ncbi:MAG TPA: glucose-6-phosphate dehydrogenase assembly protein OpcA [Candidatus Polarisedimenticolaceae bacterium]
MDVTLVERELASLWRKEASTDEAVIRASTLNLAVACTDPEDALDAAEVARKLSELHPGRVILMTPGYGSVPDARVETYCHALSDRRQVSCELITLEVPPGHHEMVPTTLLQLLVGDVPLYVWWRRTLTQEDPLLLPLSRMADRFVFNSSNSHDPRKALARVAEQVGYGDAEGLSHGRDLMWVRLDGWREMVASYFDNPSALERLSRVASVEIVSGGPATPSGATVAAAYLGGWLASRLGWTPTRRQDVWRRPDGGEVVFDFEVDPLLKDGRIGRIRLTDDTEERASFIAERLGPEIRMVKLWAEATGFQSPPRIERLNRPDDFLLLAGEIERVDDDAVFAAALDAAVSIVGRVVRKGE